MGKIYVNQTALIIRARCLEPIIGYSTLLIKYIKPDKTTGSFPAILFDLDTGTIQYKIQTSEDIDQTGKWVFWAHITFSDGTYVAGEPFTKRVYPEGK